MSNSGIRLKSLTFTGPSAEPAGLDFAHGLTIVYGASNTGKSFIAKAIDFMLGGSRPLPNIEEQRDYDAALLALVLPDGRPITLYRATMGGPILLFDGLLTRRPEQGGMPLKEEHDPKAQDNLSRFLLSSLNLDGKVVVRNSTYGEKETLSFRRLTPYLIVEEGAIMDERSPILSGQHILDTVEKNVFRLLLTGRDDAAVVSTTRTNLRQARISGQIELVDEFIARIDAELGDNRPDRADLVGQVERLDRTLADQHAELRRRQERIDALVRERRDIVDRLDQTEAAVGDIELTLVRFQELDAVFESDIGRLEALEEGGFLLMAMADQPCPVCGADPEHQMHSHGTDEIRGTHQAAAAEIAKIRRERRDLAHTTATLNADAAGLRRLRDGLASRLRAVETEIAGLRPHESELKSGYEALLTAREALGRTLQLYHERDRLAVRRSQIDVKEPRSSKGKGKVLVGVDGSTGHRFAQTVQKILREWQFPGDPTVSFDLTTHDIQLNGKERRANGKGVRAILHAAYKVAVLLYCHENNLPHPGFVVLDTPLLTYREPLRNPRYGALSADEQQLKATSLNEYFYASLAQMSDLGQFIVLENVDPPSGLADASVSIFTGGEGEGRFGLFPVGGG